MAEEPTPARSDPAPNGGNQNFLVAGVFGAAVLLILLLAVVYLQANGAGFGLFSRLGASSGGDLPATADTRERAGELAARLGGDASAIVGIVTQLSDQLAIAEEELKGTRALYANAVRKAGQTEKDEAQLRALTAEVAQLRTQLAETQALLEVSESKATALMARLATAPDAAAYRDAQAMRDQAQNELRQTQAMLARDAAEKARLQADLAAATTGTVAAGVAGVALEETATELFVEDIGRLPEGAKQLFLELARLETVDRSELDASYRRIADTIGARVIDTIPFPTGSAEIDPAKSATILAAVADASDDAFFLAIGYASKTGNFDLNKNLSSSRATAVATLADANKMPGQAVRAVFLGQTDRFSKSNIYDDQICELWAIAR